MKNKIIQSGRSMVEMMGYMAVVLSITAGVGTLISNAYSDYKYSKASLQISELASAIVRASAVDADYDEITSKFGGVSLSDEAKKLIPKSFRVAGAKIYHAFGGQVTIGTPTGDKTRFSIQFQRLSRKQCIELAMKEWQNNKSVDLYEIIINNNEPWHWAAYEAGSTNVLPVKRSAVAGAHSDDDNAQCSERYNNITWIFN